MQTLEPVLVVDLFPPERQSLLQLLAQLNEEEWQKPTVCADWTVKDVVLHILGDDIGYLSSKRDAFDSLTLTGNPPDLSMWDNLVAFLNNRNALWVEATRRMSHQLACTFLALTGAELYQYLKTLDPFAPGDTVSWASPDPAPTWLDIAREYTERWLHQQHIRDAVNRPGLKDRQFLAPILDTFVYALPQTFRTVHAPVGTTILLTISGASGGDWLLQRQQSTWQLGKPDTSDIEQVDASVVLDQETAWRLFTKGISKEEAMQHATFTGNETLAEKVLNTISIIA
ncbi:MAG: maleylpyruvate isomerase N-terminal domain-containing protein [Ktedonobacteraceae bacterium]